MDPYLAGNGHDNVDGELSDGPASTKPRPSPISDAEILAEFDHHAPGIARINNGSFGSCPSSVLSAQLRWQQLYLSQPDDFYYNRLQPSILRSRSLVRTLINAESVSEVSLVDNATTAAAIVLQHVSWRFTEGAFRKGDAVVMLHYAFGAVKKSIQAYITRAGGRVIEVFLPFPLSSTFDVVQEFKKSLVLGRANGSRVRLAVIDHITSMPSVIIPVKELTTLCRQEGVDKVFIDGAHAIGNVDVDVRDIGADFYTSSLYKWFFCPPAVAFLYCRSSPASSDLHHPVVSHEYGNGLAVESGWVGSRDYSPQLVLPAVAAFVSRFEGGIDGIRRRNHEKVAEMGKMLAESWGTSFGSPVGMCSSMAMIGLPPSLGILSDEDSKRVSTRLREEFGIEVPIYYNRPTDNGAPGNVTGYARISHQVYNVAQDYYRLRDAIHKLAHGPN